jgi:ABC-type phosphate transport system substrate-binding protein
VALIALASVSIYLATDHSPPGKPTVSGGSSPAGHPQGGSSTAGGAPTATGSQSLACATGSLQIWGSSAFQGIAQDAATAYESSCPNVTIDINKNISGQDSAFGVTKVRTAVASHAPSAGSMIAMYDGSTSLATGLEAHPIGALIYSVVAHQGLFPGSTITRDQLVNIFVNHSDPSKVAVGRRNGSGSRLTFLGTVLDVKPGPPPDPRNCPAPTGHPSALTGCTAVDTPGVINFVDKTPNAIGYAELSSLQGYPQAAALWIGGIEPTKANVLNGSYKFWTIENLYTGAQLTPLAKDFLDYLPRYIHAHPQGGFITCSDAALVVGPRCQRLPSAS